MTPDDVARVDLGFFPTPIELLPRLSQGLGVTLRLKRDDYSGFGAGGNKVRKLEYLMADALSSKASVLITTGGHQSNHARIVAAAARRFGMEAVLVLRGHAPVKYQGNLLLDRLFEAQLEFLDPDDYFRLIDDRMAVHAETAREHGKTPYIIPLGGANALGALGYVRAVAEMARQLARPPDVVVAPLGSGGTLAGLLVGARRHWPHTRLIGISVSRDRIWFQERVAAMATECAVSIGWDDICFAPTDVWVEDGYIGPGYGQPSPGGNAAIRRLAREEGVLLDPVYTGKAMDGLFGLITGGTIAAGSEVLFLHCGGGPALYPFADSLIASGL